MATPKADDTILVPLQALRESHGFSLDIGSSTTKLAYRSKDEYTNGEPRDTSQLDSDKGCLHLAMFAENQLEEVLGFIKNRCDLQQTKDKKVIHVCGRGLTQQIKDKIEAELDCQLRVENDDEMSGQGLAHLINTCKADDIFYQPSKEGLRKGKVMSEIMKGFQKSSEHSRGEFFSGFCEEMFVERKDEQLELPVLLGDMGATFRFNTVTEDGIKHLDNAPFGGSFFHGICGFFTSTKVYASLLKMAEENSGETVETTLRDYIAMMPKGREADMYNPAVDDSKMEESDLTDIRLFAMDKMVTGKREDGTPGDGVHSLLQTVCENVVSHISYNFINSGMKKVYLGGSFIHPAIVRSWITMFLMMRNAIMNHTGQPIEFEFLRYGSHLGALGAFLQTGTEYAREACT